MASKIKVDQLETADGTGTIALQNQLSGMTTASLPTVTTDKLGTGAVLQVVQDFKTDTVVGTSNSYTGTGLSATITPSSTSSKILVMFTVNCTINNGTWMLRLARGSTVIGVGDSSGSRVQSTVGGFHPTTDTNHQSNPTSAQYLDSPNTTSAITYAVQYKAQTGTTFYMNRSSADPDNSNWSHRSTSSITLIEIAG